LNSFKERLKFGQVAEDQFEFTLLTHNLEYIKLDRDPDWTPEIGRLYGDFCVKKKSNSNLVNIEVKRGSISFDCIYGTEADVFVIYFSKDEAFVYKTQTLKKYCSKVDRDNNYNILPSGDRGISLYRLEKMYNKIPLSVWIDNDL
jgi:hypothetical protein